jgi:gliding motility-associated-like protein
MNKLIPVLLLFFAFNIYSQKEANIWYFGENAGLDFSTNPPTALTDGKLNTTEGCSSFSSPSGELLFYSDGIEVFNKDHELMTYADGRLANDLKGNPSSTQSGMIIPKPGATSIYYLFTVGTDFVPSSIDPNPGFNYYTIDFSTNPLGEITDGPVNLAINPNTNADLSNVWSEKVAAVKGVGCDEVWVLSFVQNTFYSYKVDPSGVDVAGVVTSVVDFTASDKRGYLQVSPNGEKIAFADYNSGGTNINGSLVLFDFDSNSGSVNPNSSQVLIPRSSGQSPYGVAFSQQSNKLYISSYNGDFTVFQFDLESSDISSSRTEIINKEGYRGALQLGPDGKIYASIPESNFLDVIENPNDAGADINYTENAIDLASGRAMQGLPPFLSSLLLPIKITDSDTNETVNNQDLQYCLGESKTIIPEIVTGNTTPTYEWFFNNGTSTVSVATTTYLSLNNLSFGDSGIYSLVVKLTDDCGNIKEFNGTFNIKVFDAAAATKPDDIIFCDTDRDGFNSFNLQTERNLDILNGLNPATFDVLYFDSMQAANDNFAGTQLVNPYTNSSAFSSQTLYARVHNKNAPEACFDITDFRLVITNLPIVVQPEPYRICDDLESGSDTDGTINTFLLNTRDSEVLETLDTNQYHISYHTTLNGADTNDVSTVIPKDSNHSVTNSKTLFIRVENKDNPACYDADKTLDLFVDSLPVLKTNPELEQCISADDSSPTVNLTTAEVNISETANVTFEYFEDAAATTQITDPTSYAVIVNTSQSVFVRVTSEFNCARDLIELTINVGQTPDNPYNDIQPAVCDDFLDADGNNSAANSDTDFITDFSLNENAIIASINPPANTVVYFYENADDRNNTLNEIDITNYRNDIDRIDITTIASGIQFPIYYKILSTVNNNCQGLGQFYLQINATPAVSSNTLSQISECDTGAIDGNYTNGSNRNINLTQRIDELFLGTNQDQNDYDVTFYKSVTAAFSGDNTNPDYIDTPAQFTNDVPSGFSVGDIATQIIFVRVQNKTTGCANPHARFEVIINPIPIITNPIPVLAVCDIGTNDGDVRNGLAQNIDVSIRDIDIIGTRIAANFTITYHKTRADAEDLSSTGIDKNSYDSDPTRVTINPTTNRSEESLFIRIVDNSSGCTFDQSTLTIVVNPEPTFEAISNLSECDNNDDGDDANQIIQTIDLDGKITEILGASQDPDDYNVSFHLSQAAASSGNAPIASPYTNTSSIETMYVRIQNKATSCVNDDATFDVLVNSLPDFTATSPQILCLNDTPKNIYIEAPSAIYNYVWRDVDGNTIGVKDNLDVTSGGNYTVTATTTNGTNCSRTQTIVVNESNPAILLNSFVTIIDQGNNIGSEDNLSISIDTISNDLGPGDYQFAILNTNDANRTPFVGFQDKPLFENLEGAIYTIIVNDKNGCVPDATLEVSVLQFPKFFTPNGDGRNDTYIIKGANKTFYPNSSINIFNRYGKLVAQIPIDSEGWDGTYNGKKLSSDDYWYNITLIPADKTKQIINKTGNFSLLRK